MILASGRVDIRAIGNVDIESLGEASKFGSEFVIGHYWLPF